MRLVADSGRILSFARAHHLDLLRQVVHELLIPDAVYDEIVVRGAGKPGSQDVAASSWIRRQSVHDQVTVDALPPKLHRGEREAIVLAQEQGSALLVDEREARRAAVSDDITVVGTFEVLKEAKDRGVIPQVKPILDALIAAGMYLSDELYEQFLRAVGEA
jgi:predicted nucleic acid-binding protein